MQQSSESVNLFAILSDLGRKYYNKITYTCSSTTVSYSSGRTRAGEQHVDGVMQQ